MAFAGPGWKDPTSQRYNDYLHYLARFSEAVNAASGGPRTEAAFPSYELNARRRAALTEAIRAYPATFGSVTQPDHTRQSRHGDDTRASDKEVVVPVGALPTSVYTPLQPVPAVSLARDLFHPDSKEFWNNPALDDVKVEMFNCTRGEYPKLWYKFKRFETLSLLNLYYYQHELVSLESRLYSSRDGSGRAGLLNGLDVAQMRTLLKEYYKAVLNFREISQMSRPSKEARKATTELLAEKLDEHYRYAADALGLMDLTPHALGVEADAIRVMTQAVHRRFLGPETTQGPSYMAPFYHDSEPLTVGPEIPRPVPAPALLPQPRVESYTELVEEERKPVEHKNPITVSFAGRPYKVPISPVVETAARVVTSLLAGVFLLAPMFALSYVTSQGYRLMITSLFTIVFAVVLSLTSQAKNHELMTVTAAYTAVLVVFIGVRDQ